MMNSHPRISILMPVYNGSKYLRSTLESILAQTLTDYEVVCINDCSTDDSLPILDSYRAKDSRIQVFSTPTNLGTVSKVLNHVISHVRGDYFLYMSQDDLLSPDCLQSMLERAVSTGADAIMPDMVYYHEHEPHRNVTVTAPDGDKSRILTNREAVILSLDWRIHGNGLYAIRLLREIGCYDFATNADEYTGRVYLFHCNKSVFSDGVFYYRQGNPEAITTKLSAGLFDWPYTDYRLFEFLRDHDFPRDAQELVLLRSIETLSDWRSFLSKYRMKRLIGRSPGSSLNIDDAECRLRRCFDALQKAKVPGFLSEMRSARTGLIRVMLANYALFHVISLIVVELRRVRSKMNAVISRQVDHP